MSGKSALTTALVCFFLGLGIPLCAVMTTNDANQRASVALCIGGPAVIVGIIFLIVFLVKRVGDNAFTDAAFASAVSSAPTQSGTGEPQPARKAPSGAIAKTESAILARDTILGEKQPPTGKYVKVKDQERQSGMYILGVQGVGKSSLLENVIYQDIRKGFAVIVLDPHGDLIEHVIAQMPAERIKDTALLSIEDIEYPFGVNLFSIADHAGTIAESQAVDRILHVF